MTPEEQRTLDLFEAVESRPDINQRQLAEELGIALKTMYNKLNQYNASAVDESPEIVSTD